MTAITGPNQWKEKIPQGYQKSKLQQFTPEQIQLLEQMIGHLGPEGWLSKLASGDESAFEEIEAPQKRQFSDTIAGIGSRYSGMGMGGQKSSGFQNEQTSAAQNFSQQLGAQRQGLKSQALKDLMGFSNQLMGQKPFDVSLSEKPQSFLQQLLLGLSGGVGQGIGSFLGGSF